ncbi:MAG TPA: hypothetical protein VF190_06090 [Rhodothermales bacterium]
MPHSCQRIETRDVFPADSLSRALAEQTPVDSLQLAWSVGAQEVSALEYPRSIQFSPDGRHLFVSDVESGAVLRFDAEGRFQGTVTIPETDHPYVAGWKEDTLLVLDPDEHRVHYVSGETMRTVEIDAAPLISRSFVYGTQTSGGFVVKSVHAERGARLLYLDASGGVRDTTSLAGPYWRHAGFLVPWGDSLLSLCGYRPVVDVVAPDGSVDSLALQGFDSPMLSRSRLFMLGEVDEPPLLSASGAVAGPYLFVLNMRPGWLRIDAYDRSGTLQRVLTERSAPDYGFYPVDLAVHRTADGTYVLAVAVAGKRPRVNVYRWTDRSATAN